MFIPKKKYLWSKMWTTKYQILHGPIKLGASKCNKNKQSTTLKWFHEDQHSKSVKHEKFAAIKYIKIRRII